MIRLTFGIASSLLLLANTPSFKPPDLIPVGQGKDGFEYFLKHDRQLRISHTIGSFTLVAPLDPHRRAGITSYRIFERVNCKERTSIYREKTTYFEDSEPYTSAAETQEIPIESGTPSARAFSIVCSPR